MYMEERIPNAFKDYISGSQGGKSKKKKKGTGTDMDPVTGLPILRVPEMEDEQDFMWLGNPYGGMPMGTAMPPGYSGTPGRSAIPNYGPAGMTSIPAMPMSAYNPAQMMQGRQGQQSMMPMQQGYGQGGMNQIDIQYTSADGTRYNIGVVTPQENRGKALYNVLSGLYGVMMAEGQSGKYGKGGSGQAYAGAKGGYSGGKGGKG